MGEEYARFELITVKKSVGKKNLAQLKSAGKIRIIGGRKGGHWEVVKGDGK